MEVRLAVVNAATKALDVSLISVVRAEVATVSAVAVAASTTPVFRLAMMLLLCAALEAARRIEVLSPEEATLVELTELLSKT